MILMAIRKAIMHTKLFRPTRAMIWSVRGPSESNSLMTKRVAAGAVAMERTPSKAAVTKDPLRAMVKARKTIKKVASMSFVEKNGSVFLILLNLLLSNSVPI